MFEYFFKLFMFQNHCRELILSLKEKLINIKKNMKDLIIISLHYLLYKQYIYTIYLL